MHRIFKAAIFAVALATTASSMAFAQVRPAIEQSGRVLHAAVCPGPAGPGSARCHAHVVVDRAGNPIFAALAPNATPSGYGPAQLRTAYNVPSATGTPTIAIVDAYGYNNAESDLAKYRAQFGLPPCTTNNGCFRKINQRGTTSGYPSQNTGWAQEQALDIDMASAICPSCHILLVQADSASFANLATAENTAAGYPGVVVVSNSYGGTESGSAAYASAYNKGVAITVSSGDSGYGVQFPASAPTVTAVGGTSLYSGAGGYSETAWSGAGSGCSTVYTKPTWQKDSCAKRTVADVSAVADPNTGVAVYGPAFGKFSGWLVFGGTSVAAPIIAGVYAVNGSQGIYGSDPYSGAAGSLHDVTSGSNGSCGGSYLCTAGVGYDGPTGLGTPNGASAF